MAARRAAGNQWPNHIRPGHTGHGEWTARQDRLGFTPTQGNGESRDWFTQAEQIEISPLTPTATDDDAVVTLRSAILTGQFHGKGLAGTQQINFDQIGQTR